MLCSRKSQVAPPLRRDDEIINFEFRQQQLEPFAEKVSPLSEYKLAASLASTSTPQPTHCQVAVDDNHLLLATAFSSLGQAKAQRSFACVEGNIRDPQLV